MRSRGIEDLLKRADIVDVIGSYIPLKKSGNNYIARCPFHPDDTPSLSVSPSRGIWKCFGCGVGGDAIKFVAMYENISYPEAILRLAKKYNVNIDIRNEKKDKFLYKVLEEVAFFYHKKLEKERRAIEYLKSRGVSSKEIQAFTIGFSSSSDDLVDFLKKRDLLEHYEKTRNLIKVSDHIYRDIFLNRIIIPIRDSQGNVVAFGARAIDDTKPKYINSPESEIFKKGNTLFNLHIAKEYIKGRGYAIVVEGYFDVISLYTIGFKNTVALLGTALTEHHAKELSKYTKEVILLFDADHAGQKAVFSTLPNLLMHGLKVRVAFLPNGQDPDSMARTNSKELIKLINNSKEIFEILIKSVDTINSQAFKDTINLISYLPDKLHQEHLLREISEKVKIAVSVLRESMPKLNVKKAEKVQTKEKLSFAEKVVLKACIDKGLSNVPLDKILLSPAAMLLLEEIKNHNLDSIDEEILNLDVKDLDVALNAAIKTLSIDIKMSKSHAIKKRVGKAK